MHNFKKIHCESIKYTHCIKTTHYIVTNNYPKPAKLETVKKNYLTTYWTYIIFTIVCPRSSSTVCPWTRKQSGMTRK
jgi:hypothetical protein